MEASKNTNPKTVYIISYFGGDDMREKRKAIHDKQLSFFTELGFDVKVLSQEYRDADYSDLKGVEYIDIPKVNISFARNKALAHFYATDLDWAFFFDNDTTLYDHCMGKGVFEKVVDMIDDAPEIDAFCFIHGATQPFNSVWNEKKFDYPNELVFRRVSHFPTQAFFLRNFRKTLGKEFFFDTIFFEENEHGLKSGEDNDFFLNLTTQNRGVYRCWNAVIKEASGNNSTWCHDQTMRVEAGMALKLFLSNRYGSFGVELKNGRLLTRRALDLNPNPATIVLPRKIKSTLEDLF